MTWSILVLGILFRLGQYLANRPMWYDEAYLAANIRTKTCAEMFGPLWKGQVAPAGFLVVERTIAETLGDGLYALRLVPLAGGIGALLLFLAVARRCLTPGAVPVALALMAVSDDLIYFSSELKPYSTDVALALACLLMGLAIDSRPLTIRRTVAFGMAGALAVWFSFPIAFVLAGVGIVSLGRALLEQDWGRASLIAMLGLAWSASLAGCRDVASIQLGGDASAMMDAFWGFAFLPVPPRSLGDLTWPLTRGLFLFVNPLSFNPLDLGTPLGPSLAALPAVALFLVGSRSLWRRDRRVLGMLGLPGVLVLLASGVRAYPFHGRMVLFLVPALLLIIAEGADRVRLQYGPGAIWGAVLIALFLLPTLHDLHRLVEPRQRLNFHRHGDYRPSYIEPESFPFGWPPARVANLDRAGPQVRAVFPGSP